MRLIIAEKKELAVAISEAIFTGGCKKEGRTIKCGDTVLTWAYGHLLRLCDPEDYDAKYQKWNVADLPIFFEDWKNKPIPKKKDSKIHKKEQLDFIHSLLKDANEVVNAGDADAEGQYLIDEILEYFNYKGKVYRLSTADLTPENLLKAYSEMEDNEKFKSIGESARARAIADFTVGINYSRYFSVLNNKMLSVGRVQTSTLGLVINRDLQIENHIKNYYYECEVKTNINGVPVYLNATLPKGRITENDKEKYINKAELNEAVAAIVGKEIKIYLSKTKREEQPPLPFNLVELQTAASKKFGYSPEQTDKFANSLRLNYKLITYARSTCRYLQDDQFKEAPSVINATLDNLNAKIYGLNSNIRSQAFSSKKVGNAAHTGIITTSMRADLTKLSQEEKNIYRLVAAQYLAQFMPPAIKIVSSADATEKTTGIKLSASANVIAEKGFRYLISVKKSENKNQGLCDIPAGEYTAIIEGYEVIEKETRPPARYTLASLNKDMTSVAKYVTDSRIKNLLLAKDDGKEGENGSIGTPATRTLIVKTLIKRGFLTVDSKNKVTSTKLGREFYNILPDNVKKPDLTAEWWALCQDIQEGVCEPKKLYN